MFVTSSMAPGMGLTGQQGNEEKTKIQMHRKARIGPPIKKESTQEAQHVYYIQLNTEDITCS